jgi:hypothetical protein
VIVFLTIWISDKHDRKAKKIRRQRGTHRLILPVFRTRRQVEKAAMEIQRQRSAHRLIHLAVRTRRPLTKAAPMKVRRQRNALHLKLPAFCTRRQREKLNLLKHASMASSRIRETRGDHAGTAQVANWHVDLERIVIAFCCLLMSIFFIVVIVVGRD